MIWLLIPLCAALALALIGWLFIIAEGAYFGSKVVILLYDWGATSYDRIKDLDPLDEVRYLAGPVLSKMQGIPSPHVLDVATGTGRLPLALLHYPDFNGDVVGVDLSAKMLAQARRKTALFRDRITLIQQRADVLPFRDGCFDAVTCLEALEFMPDPRLVVAELVRVLRPGGILLVSNRVGWEARLLPGRQCGRGRMERLLSTQPLEDIRTERWQVHYDLIWARKRNRGMK